MCRMLIGQVAGAFGIPTRTVRFYERKGLLPEPERAKNGYRIYDDTSLARVKFIRSAQNAGLTLAEIASIIRVRDEGTAPCKHVDDLLAAKLVDVRDRRRHLADLESELVQLLDRSSHLDPADSAADGEICRIFDTSDEAEQPPTG